jgi:PilZ domain
VQRFPFVAGVQVTALDTGVHLVAHTEDLSLFGCFVETTTPFAQGTKVRLRISHGGAVFAAEGGVAFSRDRAGMGMIFTSIEPSSISILDNWLAEAAKTAVTEPRTATRSGKGSLK